MRLLFHAAAALVLLLCCQSGSLAQANGLAATAAEGATREESSQRLAAAQPTDGIQSVKPDTFVLPDEHGNLQSMLGWTFEDFLRVWRSREVGRPLTEEPRYSLQRIECQGRLENDGFVRLAVTVEVRMQTDQRTRVPLGFPNGILVSYELNSGEDADYVYFDEGLGEHAMWTSGDVGKSRAVEMQVLLPLTQRGDQTVLRFHAPRAAVSQMTLELSGTGFVAESITAATQVSTTTEEGRTHINARGLGEATELAWRSLEQAAEGDTRTLVGESEIHILAEENFLRSEVDLSVRDLRGELNRFRISLPAGHRLVSYELTQGELHRLGDRQTPVDAAGASVPYAPPAPAAARADEATGGVYEVRLEQSQQLPVALKLVLQRPLSVTEEGTEVTLAGVQVLDAAGQQGHVGLTVSEDFRVRWHGGQRIRQVATPREGGVKTGLTATFEFDSADWELPLILAQRRTEISVEPEYELEIGREGLSLTATFRYSVRGTLREALRYSLGDWELAEDPMGPESTIRGNSAYVDSTGTMYLSLANPAEGSFETSLRLRMRRQASASLLQIKLPECLIDDPIQEGRIKVTSEPTLEVVPQLQSSRGLASGPQFATGAAPPEPLEDPAQEYRVVSLPAEYVALVRPRKRIVASETRLTAQVYADHVFVEQEHHLDVRHLPTNDLVLRVPGGLLALSPPATYSLDGQSVAPSWERLPPDAEPVGGQLARFVLEQPQLGPAVLRIRYQVPLARDEASAASWPQELSLPVTVPEADSHRLVVTLANKTDDLQVQLGRPTGLGSSSEVEGYPPVNPDDPFRVEIAAPFHALPVAIKPSATTSQHAVLVDRMWIQTWIAGNSLQTRTVLQLVPATEEITLELGRDGASALQGVWMNKEPVVAGPDERARLALPTAGLKPAAPCVIEVIQQGPFSVDDDGRLRVLPPRVAGARSYGNVFWQLILPQSWHGFGASEEFVSETPWRFQGTFWAREPRMSQTDLEGLFGVTPTPGPPAASNELLMVAFELPPALEAKLVRRSSIVLWTSGGVLVVGIVVLYVRRLQRWEVAFAAAAAVAILGILYPSWSPFIAQAGVLGGVLVLIAVFLKEVTGRWQASFSRRPAADTGIFRREASPLDTSPVPSPEPVSSARALVHSLTESGAQHPA
jgi:hypothetical protein